MKKSFKCARNSMCLQLLVSVWLFSINLPDFSIYSRLLFLVLILLRTKSIATMHANSYRLLDRIDFLLLLFEFNVIVS
jgi:hypothetical protein